MTFTHKDASAKRSPKANFSSEANLSSAARLSLIVLAMMLAAACAARDRAANAEQPRADEVPPPILLSVPADRDATVQAAWSALLREQGVAAATLPTLRSSPATKTILALPTLPTPLRLPRVGDSAAQSDQRTANERESLRRFVDANSILLGTTSNTTTLVSVAEPATNSRRAVYEQRPFIYPLRGDYGRIIIDYTTDGRVLNLTSTALPGASTADAALRNLRARLTADDARRVLAGKTLDVLDRASGTFAPRAIASDVSNQTLAAQATELVIYPLPREASDGGATSIELRLAWEFRVTDAPRDFVVYVNALDGEIFGAMFVE